jgi:hypothetical protein
MSKVRRVALAAGLVLAVVVAAIPSSAAPSGAKARSSADHPHGPSPALRAMLREVDARRIQRDITALAGAGTRHTLSSQDDPNRGIGAAPVFALCDFPDDNALDRALAGLPISVALGAGAKTTTWAVYPYEQFADFLHETVEGG